MKYLLTVSRMDYSARKKRWSDSTYDPGIRKFGTRELLLAYPGVLTAVGEGGELEISVPLLSPKGMLAHPEGWLVSCYSEVRLFSPDLTASRTFLSEPWCNDLHSLRPTRGGVAIAVSGVDAAFEFTADGAVTWEWWAAENGFPLDMNGKAWSLGRGRDHRNYSYPVDLQSTHINAIAPLDDDAFVATLLHRNCLIRVERRSGRTTKLLEDLGRPHAVRVLEPGLISLADTTNGRAMVVRVAGERAEIVEMVSVDSPWVHDAFFTGEGWIFADGANSRVLHTDLQGKVFRTDVFDPEWCLYEVLPIKDEGRRSDAGPSVVRARG